jgi:hypothetical protein
MLFSILAAALLGAPAAAQSISTSSVMPTYLSLAPNINEFTRFADGGPDGNWYVGYNNAWIVKLPPAPAGDFAKAYIGAKVGRAKTKPLANKPWLRERIEGRLYMGVSQQPAFSSEQSFFLVDAVDIPLEGDPQTFVEGVGAGEWMWAEVPLSLISFNKPNYLIIWSPSKYFVKASSAPILAGAEVVEAPEEGSEPRAWNNHSIMGVPPRSPAGALETPLTNMSPALAIKLVPNAESEVSVGDFSIEKAGRRVVAQFSVAGTDVAEAWLETSRDQLDWSRASHYRRQQPYIISLNAEKLTPGTFLRAAARDSLGKVGYSDAIGIPYAPR